MLAEIKAAVVAQGVATAMIIDDVYDPTPTLAHIEQAAWNQFLDDLKTAERALIKDRFGRDVDEAWEELKAEEAFVQFVWEQRARSEVFANLFSAFDSATMSGRAVLDRLQAFLRDQIGLTVGTGGTKRDARAGAPTEDDADIVFMDLFLGPAQDSGARASAVARVVELVSRRRTRPPLLVLMSSSIRLDAMLGDFRDDAGLLGCQFRTLQKPDIDNIERLHDIVYRLVARYKDTLRLAGYVEAWQQALGAATIRLLRRIRRLDLRDYADLQTMILNAENERVGAYALELYDRVFQYELEGDATVLAANKELDQIPWRGEYLAPHFLPAKDAMDILDGLLFYHPAAITADDSVTLGDILFVKLDAAQGKAEVPSVDVTKGESLALLVMTQACDLRRGGVGRLLFIPGVARPMDLKDHKRPDALVTPVMRVETKAFTVSWYPQATPITCTETELKSRIAGGEYKRVRRFRTIYALQLQQRFAANLTRIGTMVMPHVRHVVALRAFFRGRDGTLSSLLEVGLDPEQAVVMVGRDKEQVFDQVALATELVERLRGEMRKVDRSKLAAGEQAKWERTLVGHGLFRALEHGVPYSRSSVLRPLRGTPDDIFDVVGPYSSDAPKAGAKSRLSGPLILHIPTSVVVDDTDLRLLGDSPAAPSPSSAHGVAAPPVVAAASTLVGSPRDAPEPPERQSAMPATLPTAMRAELDELTKPSKGD